MATTLKERILREIETRPRTLPELVGAGICASRNHLMATLVDLELHGFIKQDKDTYGLTDIRPLDWDPDPKIAFYEGMGQIAGAGYSEGRRELFVVWRRGNLTYGYRDVGPEVARMLMSQTDAEKRLEVFNRLIRSRYPYAKVPRR